ncbi:MAG: hypothetical protein EP338_01090 [Bacteroidetes bacterium]|nr:MAG: hypothetical protein EP338_01090 [Bacteroidota bacterium]
MADRLIYRYPGKEVTEAIGFFRKLDSKEQPHGFVVSNLDLSDCYQFVESKDREASWHFLEERPYCMSAREYYLQAHELLNGINLMQMDKAVFSRVKAVSFEASQAEKLFDELEKTYPNALVYLLSSELFGTWIGATPEILMEVHRDYLFTISLAGTRDEQEKSREWTAKEKWEQQVVTDYIEEVSKRKQLSDLEIVGPYDYDAGPVSHLRSDISAQMNGISPWEVASSLHPTPAVAGYPQDQSLSLIDSVEPHKRGLYTGLIGFVDDESARLYVNLRCAQIQEEALFLYLGGGYTPQSIPEQEWIETENKSKTILNCVKRIAE